MNRLTSDPLATSRRDIDRSATNPRNVDTRKPAAPSFFTLEAGGFAFTFPTDHIAGVRAIRGQAIASYRAVVHKQHTARDLAFLLDFPHGGDTCVWGSKQTSSKGCRQRAGGKQQRPNTARPAKADGDCGHIRRRRDGKPPRRSGRHNETRQSPTPVLPAGRNHRRIMGDPEPAMDAVTQTLCSLPREGGSGCSRGSEEPETNTDSPISDRSSPILARSGSGSFMGDYSGFREAKRATGLSLNWVQGIYCERKLSICGQLAEVEPFWPLCTGCRNRSKRQWRGPCMFMVGGGDENFSSLRCATCVKRGIHCHYGIDVIKD